jgi:hypothetical protein
VVLAIYSSLTHSYQCRKVIIICPVIEGGTLKGVNNSKKKLCNILATNSSSLIFSNIHSILRQLKFWVVISANITFKQVNINVAAVINISG